MVVKKKKKPGKRHYPSKLTRDMVYELARINVPHATIAEVLGIGYTTLEKHYRHILDFGKTFAIQEVANALYNAAIQGGDVTAMIFILKTQAGWKEPPKEIAHDLRLVKMSPEERDARIIELNHKLGYVNAEPKRLQKSA